MPTKAPRSGVRPGTRSTRSTAAGSSKPRVGMTRGGGSRAESSRSDTRHSNHSNSAERNTGGRNNSVWGSTRKSGTNGASGSAGSMKNRDSSAHRNGGGNESTGDANSGSVLSFIVVLIIIAIAFLQFAQVLTLYVQNRKELDAAKSQEAQLAAQKADLEDEIQRWGDKTYVEAQARSRLGFVYSGEKPVYLINTGRDSDSDTSTASGSQKTGSTMPWYKELMYSLQKSDDTSGNATDATIGKVLGTQSSDASSSLSASQDASASADASASGDAASSDAGSSGESANAGGSDSSSSAAQ